MMRNLKSRNQNLVVQEFEDETLIYDLTVNKAYCLNETAAFVWKSLDGETDVKAIADNLAAKTKSVVNEEIVWLAIENFKKDNLIANVDALPNRFEGMNRREVVKRIGLATMIALPVVSSLIAPTATMASSACAATPKPSDCPVGTVILNRANPAIPPFTCDGSSNGYYSLFCSFNYDTQCQSGSAVAGSPSCTSTDGDNVTVNCVCT